MSNRENHAALYTRINGERGPLSWLCTYCGDPADSIDHVPPVSRIDDFRAYKLERELFLTTPCCRSCNSILGSSLQESIVDRCEHLKNRLARRVVRSPSWDEDELAELGKNLRSKILEGGIRRKHMESRVNYYAGIDIVIAELDV